METSTEIILPETYDSIIKFNEESSKWSYVEDNYYFAIPCLVFLFVVTVFGTIGNIFVIGAVVASKVRWCCEDALIPVFHHYSFIYEHRFCAETCTYVQHV